MNWRGATVDPMIDLHVAPPLTLPMVYINLDEDRSRREHIQARFGAAGLTPQRFAAVRWSRLPPARQAPLYSEALNAATYYRALVAGEKGCYASHLGCWQALVDSDAPALVVVEDDVLPAAGFADVVNAIAALPPGWDMVKLIVRKRERPAARRPLCAGFEWVTFGRVPSLTAGYVISRRGARKLLATRLPFGRPIDVDLRLWWENRLVIRGVMPAAIALAAGEAQSSIGARHGQPDLHQRWRKFLFKLRYTMANAAAREP